MYCPSAVILTLFALSVEGGFPSLPVHHVEGSNYQIGLSIGQTFIEQITYTTGSNSFLYDRILPYNRTKEGAELYTKFLHSAQELYPHYLDEIRGMADGTKISFDLLFLWNMAFEYQLMLEPRVHHIPTPACSDIYRLGDTKTIMGHNEDGATIDISMGYMVNATLANGNRFFAYCYPGELCGNAFGYNFVTQIATTCNALFPSKIDGSAVGRNFLNRALLSQTYSEIQDTLKKVRCASGFSMNVGWKNSDGSHAVSNFEVSPTSAMETVYKTGQYGYHFNMYLHSPGVPQYKDPSSEHRLARIKELPVANNLTDVLSYLGDTKDPQYPIYRTATPPDEAATIATAAFELSSSGSMFSVYRDNPSLTKPVMTVPLD